MASISPIMRQLGCLRPLLKTPESILGRRTISTAYTPKPDAAPLPSKLPKTFMSQLPTRLRPDQGLPFLVLYRYTIECTDN